MHALDAEHTSGRLPAELGGTFPHSWNNVLRLDLGVFALGDATTARLSRAHFRMNILKDNRHIFEIIAGENDI